MLTVVNRLEGLHQLPGRQRLGQISGCPLLQGRLDELRMEVPRVHHHPVGFGARDQSVEVPVIGLGLGKGVIQRDVDRVLERGPGVELCHFDPLGVLVEHVGHADHDDVVVIDQCQRDRSR